MKLNQKEQEFWDNFLKLNPNINPASKVEANIAGNGEVADNLLNLYLIGKKTAGSSLLKEYENAGEPLPKIGDYWIILNANREPKCIVKNCRIEFYQFDKVPLEVAISEGEGDLSLEYWYEGHRWFFAPLLEGLGITNLDKETLVTEFFELVYYPKNNI